MTARTPYDDDRSTYSRRALARLVLSHQASGLSDAAGSLAVTRYDEFSGAGGRVGEAAAAGHADRLVTSAVIYERERGSSWSDIGRHLELSGPAAEERFAAAVEQWRAAFDVPYRPTRPPSLTHPASPGTISRACEPQSGTAAAGRRRRSSACSVISTPQYLTTCRADRSLPRA